MLILELIFTEILHAFYIVIFILYYSEETLIEINLKINHSHSRIFYFTYDVCLLILEYMTLYYVKF